MEPTEIIALASLVARYGPALATGITNIFAKLGENGVPTLAMVNDEFSGLEPYSDYGVRPAGQNPS